jgi:sugar transferase (PEP-CTERM/EpsH1 system associated)
MIDVLYLSHCAVDRPDKGEKIRAHAEVEYLAARCRLHVVCFARSAAEEQGTRTLDPRCASVYVERLDSGWPPLARGLARFLTGGSLLLGYYGSARLRRHVGALVAAKRPDATVVYTAAMMQYAPRDVPIVVDLVDVDSEKWAQYSRERFPGWLYGVEAKRLRAVERGCAGMAQAALLATAQERALFEREVLSNGRIETVENGVDFAYFDPGAAPDGPGGRYIVFVGAMDYYPNSDGACRFARDIHPRLREQDPELRFVVAGRNPSAEVRALAGDAIGVTGAVPDVRPYLKGALAVVAPLRIARGIQNKVLEALAMGKRVLASPAVCATFGEALPYGVTRCEQAGDYQEALRESPASAEAIRARAQARFSWEANLERLWERVREAAE